MTDIEKEVNEFVLNFPRLPEAIIRGTLLELGNAIIDGTPVDTGRLKGNWVANTKVPKTNTTENTDAFGTKTKAKLRQVTDMLKLGDIFYLTNNLPYARKIEYGGSQKAPKGMVRINLQRAQRMLDSHIKRHDR